MEFLNLSGKTVIVTGANGGIGQIISKAFADYKCNVVLCDLKLSDLEELAEEIRSKGANVLTVECDVTNSEDISTLISKTLEEFQSIDVLVNNAGIASKRIAIEEYPLDNWQQMMDINLTGIFMLSQQVGKVMLEQGAGSIVNISSGASYRALPGNLAYCVSKSGVNMLTKGFGSEWADKGVRVNAVAPAYVETPMVAYVRANNKDFDKEILSRVPMKRMGRPEEIANGVLFLASDASSYMTGEIIAIDGAATARG